MKEALKAEARKVAEECLKEGWDGYDAKPVTEAAVADVCCLIDALPDGILRPDFVAPEPNGQMMLEWQGNGRHLILSGSRVRGHIAFSFDGGFPSAVGDILRKYFRKD